MSDPSRRNGTQPLALVAAFAVLALLVVVMTSAVTAQDDPPPPTSEFSFNLEPTPDMRPTTTFDPQMLPSLTGVGATPLSANVSIRSGPGLEFRRISFLAVNNWIDIVGWNGWEDGRECSPQFEDDLDMWVQVSVGSGYGWIARCVLDIRGLLTDLPLVTETGERILQR